MKIYTKTGDQGSTGLYGSGRVSKSSIRIQLLGDIDELNATLGLAAVAIADERLFETVQEIQRRLFDLGAEVGNPKGDSVGKISDLDVRFLEDSIDEITDCLPPLRAFILPGGSLGAAHLHLARTVCRRSERTMVALNEIEGMRDEVKIYLNRLSDWLFCAARSCNIFDKSPEIEWHARGITK